jgi:hypothetical protein
MIRTRSSLCWGTRFILPGAMSFVFCFLLAIPIANADLININFSGTAYTGTTETSPATPTGPAGTWNNLTTGTLNAAGSYETDSVAVLLSDGSTGPTLTFDASGGTSSNNSWTGDTGVTLTTRDFTTAAGVYNVPNLYEAGLVNGSNSRTTGYRLKGLSAGTYEVYVVPFYRNEVQAGTKTDTSTLSFGLGNDTDARNAGDYTLTLSAANPTVNIDTTLNTWKAATTGADTYNYIGATVSIDGANRWLTFLFSAPVSTVGGDRPGPGVIQIRSVAAVPEGSAFVLVGLIGSTVAIVSVARSRHRLCSIQTESTF